MADFLARLRSVLADSSAAPWSLDRDDYLISASDDIVVSGNAASGVSVSDADIKKILLLVNSAAKIVALIEEVARWHDYFEFCECGGMDDETLKCMWCRTGDALAALDGPEA